MANLTQYIFTNQTDADGNPDFSGSNWQNISGGISSTGAKSISGLDFSSLGNGSHTIYVKFRDGNQKETNVVFDSVLVNISTATPPALFALLFDGIDPNTNSVVSTDGDVAITADYDGSKDIPVDVRIAETADTATDPSGSWGTWRTLAGSEVNTTNGKINLVQTLNTSGNRKLWIQTRSGAGAGNIVSGPIERSIQAPTLNSVSVSKTSWQSDPITVTANYSNASDLEFLVTAQGATQPTDWTGAQSIDVSGIASPHDATVTLGSEGNYTVWARATNTGGASTIKSVDVTFSTPAVELFISLNAGAASSSFKQDASVPGSGNYNEIVDDESSFTLQTVEGNTAGTIGLKSGSYTAQNIPLRGPMAAEAASLSPYSAGADSWADLFPDSGCGTGETSFGLAASIINSTVDSNGSVQAPYRAGYVIGGLNPAKTYEITFYCASDGAACGQSHDNNEGMFYLLEDANGPSGVPYLANNWNDTEPESFDTDLGSDITLPDNSTFPFPFTFTVGPGAIVDYSVQPKGDGTIIVGYLGTNDFTRKTLSAIHIKETA